MAEKKNILLMVADDLGKFVGCYGCPSIKTPHLDKLASQGVKFDMAFACTPSCSGSRSTIYTGLHTHENGQYGLNWFRSHFQTFDHVDSAPKLFNQAGYNTGIIGKVHVGPKEVYPWTHQQESETRDVAWVADQAEAYMSSAKDKGQPFFLTIGYIDPHRDITTRGEFGNTPEQYGPRLSLDDVSADDVEVPHWITDLPQTRTEFVEYYRAIQRTDTGVGLILDALERQGLADSTLVVFTSDNGPPFINSKTTLYDAGIHLPLIIRAPNTSIPGLTNPNMASFIDILPTFLDWANIPQFTRISAKSPTRLGRSLLPILTEASILPESSWQHHIFGSHTFHEMQNYWPTRVLRSRRYKYHRNLAWRLDFPFAADLYASRSFEAIRNMPPPVKIGERDLKAYIFRPAEELYDLEADPHELHNLAVSPNGEHQALLKEYREKLTAWQQRTGDLWLLRDGQSTTVLSRYAKDGLTVPDRLDFDAEKPGTEGVESTKWLVEDAYAAGPGGQIY